MIHCLVPRRLLKIIIICIFAFAVQISTVNAYTIKKIVIDPGHGGFDPGAVSGVKEKDLALKISLHLSRYLRNKGLQVYLTRDDDYYMNLSDRVAIANRFSADLFISIHVNSSEKKFNVLAPEGMEIYYYSETPSDEYAARVAEYENRAGIDKDLYNEPGFFDINRMLEQVERDYYRDISHEICVNLLDNMVRTTGLKNRGVHSAPFFVLRNAMQPAILIETGFINNAGESEYIQSQSFLEKLCKAFDSLLYSYNKSSLLFVNKH